MQTSFFLVLAENLCYNTDNNEKVCAKSVFCCFGG